MKNNKTIAIVCLLLCILVLSCKPKKAVETNTSVSVSTEGIRLSKTQMQLANIKVEPVSMSNIGHEIVFSGKLVENQNTAKVISLKVAGRIDRLYFKATGDAVNKGDALYDIYSEELIAAQKEFVLALEKQKQLGNAKNDYTAFIESAKNKLLLYGLTETQIAQLKTVATGTNDITICSPSAGYIRALKMNEGDYAMQGAAVVELSDYTSLWIEAQVYANEMEFIHTQAPITYVVAAFPDEVLKGTIAFVNPEVEQNTNIDPFRVEIANPVNKYKPGMMVEVKLKTNGSEAINIPTNAIIEDATGSIVWVQDTVGVFKSRMVTIGIRNSDRVEILSGLKVNEKVVISGAYLLNSEYILKHGSDPMAGMKM